MPRRRLNISEVLHEIERYAGPESRQTADRLFWLAKDLGAEPWPRRQSVALRFDGPTGGPTGLTFVVLSTAGTVYNNWHHRWAQAGVSPEHIKDYEQAMVSSLGREFVGHPSRYDRAASLASVASEWATVERVLTQAAGRITRAVAGRNGTSRKGTGDSADSALEGLLTEGRATRRGRSSSLRRTALALAQGRCAACERDFDSYLDGRGRSVLHVHHRKQLAARDMPTLTKVSDLAVVCANCHAILHSDVRQAMTVETLRALIRADRDGRGKTGL